MNKLSFSSNSVLNNPFEWVYELEDIGYTGWEMVQDGIQCLSLETLPQIQDILTSTNLTLTLHLPFSDMNLAGLNHGIRKEVIRQMKALILLADGIIDLAVVHPGYLSPHGAKMPDKAWDINIKSLMELCDYADDYGITIAVENMPNIPMVFGKEPEEMLKILSEVDRDNIGITLDVGHANTLNMVHSFPDICKNEIIHMHIHDNKGQQDEHLPLGEGTIDWKAVRKSLQQYNGCCVTELRTLDDGKKSLEYLSNL